MRILGTVRRFATAPVTVAILVLGSCTDQAMTPMEVSDVPVRHLRLAFNGEMAVLIKINGQNLTDSTLASRLRVDLVIDPGRPTYAGSISNKTIRIDPAHTQASIVSPCPPGSCELNVLYHDMFNLVPTLPTNEGTLADGDYTVKLFRDGSTLIGSKAIAVNHPNTLGSNGTFLDEANDQTVIFYLKSNLTQDSVRVIDAHTRASQHLSANVTRPASSDTTINVGQSLSVKGSTSGGLSGNSKKYAWRWNATGTTTETFDTEFSTSNTASHSYATPGDYQIRLIVRDGNDNPDVAPRGGHYAVSVTKTVHVVDFAPVASVEVAPSSAVLDPGYGVLLDAIMRDASGNILTGRTVGWTTSNPAVVTVPSQGDPVFATAQGGGTATITATSEGVSGYANIMVNAPADDATAAGNTLPVSIVNGDMVSVTVSMKNTGGTTWTSANYYDLLISQGGQYWIPGQAFLMSAVSPGATYVFAFDLGLDDPYRTGNTACYHRMEHAGFFFGEENGRIINVIGGNFMSSMAAASMETESMLEEVADPESWLVGARATKPRRFGPGGNQMGAGEAQLLTYRYQHAVSRTVDVVFKIVVDPTQAEILPPQVGADGSSLRWRVGTITPGEYWVRLAGTIPAGTGTIGGFPVKVLPGKSASGVLGAITLYYPGE